MYKQIEEDFKNVLVEDEDRILIKLVDDKIYELKVALTNTNAKSTHVVLGLFDKEGNYLRRASETPKTTLVIGDFIAIERHPNWGISKALNQHPLFKYEGSVDNGMQFGAARYRYLGQL